MSHRLFTLVLIVILIIYVAIVIKPSNIRIWIHDKDIGKLTQVLWEGQGNRLRTEICSNNRVKKFLDAVPYVMVSNTTHTHTLHLHCTKIDIQFIILIDFRN